jgi:hypothetical protein
VAAGIAAAPVVVSACSSALAQGADEEDALAAMDFIRETPWEDNAILIDGGTGQCHQIAVIGSDCRDPDGRFPASCCVYSRQALGNGPWCLTWAPTAITIQQVGHGFCCTTVPFGSQNWRRWEDVTQACGFCGGVNPGPNECCTQNRDIVQKYPIVNKSDCPNPVQDLPNHPQTSNGCGSDAARRAGYGMLVPQGYGPIDWTQICDLHDNCYSTCGADKATCDGTFVVRLKDTCIEYYAPLVQQLKEDGEFEMATEAQLNLKNCVGRSNSFYNFVSDQVPGVSRFKPFGQQAFDDSQAVVCRCCE